MECVFSYVTEEKITEDKSHKSQFGIRFLDMNVYINGYEKSLMGEREKLWGNEPSFFIDILIIL